MGFLRKKKYIQNEEKKQNEEQPPMSVDDIEDEEDDFSPIKEKTAVSREEFKKAASENLIEHLTNQAEENGESDEISREEPDETVESAEGEEQTEINEVSEQEDPAIQTESDKSAEPHKTEQTAVEIEPDEMSVTGGTPEATEPELSDTETDTGEPPKKEKKSRKPFKEVFNEHKAAFISAISIASVLFATVLAIYIYGCCTLPPSDRMGRNVYIENVNVSNLTKDEAMAKLAYTSLLSNQEITLTCNNTDFKIDGAEVGLTPRIQDTVSKALLYGKTNNIFVDGFTNALQIFKKHTVIPHADVDEMFLRSKLSEFGVQIHGQLVEHTLAIGDGVVVCTPGHSGFDGNTDTAFNEIVSAIANEQFHNIRVTLNSGQPHSYTADDVDAFTYCNPIIAWYQYQDNTVNVIPEIPGRYINKEEAADLISQLKEGGETVYIPYYTSTADITAETLQAKLFNAQLGSYTTSYGGSTSNRCANIKNAASKIDGKVLAPGEVFSFNGTVGKRSVANGFFTATEYANGEAVQGIGGGTCQVSSTLYNAVLYSDLSIVSRTEHMFPVGYCPLGQDATVADSGIDFKFSNNTDYPIKISAVTTGYSITVSIIGTQCDEPVTVKIVNTATKNDGNTSVRSVREVYNTAGELIRKENLSSSYYRAH